ncbi:serine hydrolase [Synechococcus sp. AH-601-J22]|nr:serine hydrolase [Synechococcus sp. AH-601-J22]
MFGRTGHWQTLGSAFVVLAAAGLTLPYAHKTFNLARAGTAYSAKMLCSGVLMAGMDGNRLKSEELALAKGLVQTQIDTTRGVVHAWAFLGLVRGKAVRQGNLGCSQAINNDLIYWSYPYEELFKPIGMESAYLETDASGNFVASSLGWASARDWARFGLLYLNQGAWNGLQILPKSWVQHAVTASKGSKKRYGAHWWLSSKSRRPDLPRNSYSAEGYEGQLILVVPSFKTVIVRLGQSPQRSSFNPNKFGASILSTLTPQKELQPNETP